MTDITFKVARKGEGKTKWLLEVAHAHVEAGRPVYYYTDYDTTYGLFCEKYFRTYSSICPVKRLGSQLLTGKEVILIDDLLAVNCSLRDLLQIQHYAYKIYATVEGVTEDKVTAEPTQISIFDKED